MFCPFGYAVKKLPLQINRWSEFLTFDTNLENRSAPPKKQTEQIDKSMATGKCGKILIVDDNEDVLLSLNMLLKPYV